MNSSERIKSYIRIRPFNKRELFRDVIQLDGSYEMSVVSENVRKTYSFEHIFTQTSTQSQIFNKVVSPIIDDVIIGFNCTIFAYGQTSSGKTYTMEGDNIGTFANNPHIGIIPRAINELFEKIRDKDGFMEISYIQIYNEDIFDLLSETETKLTLYKDVVSQSNGVIMRGLKQVRVESLDHLHQLLKFGVNNRQNAATLSNPMSSRSHSVCTVTINVFDAHNGQRMLKTTKLNMVDLAGSENIGRSGSVDMRAREAGKINQSLLTLGRVIKALTENSKHIPYRESKLTRILEDSLGGHTRTCLIATISPSLSSLDETISTLDYARMAETIENKPQISKVYGKTQLLEMYDEQIEKLKDQLRKTKNADGFFMTEDRYSELTLEISHQTLSVSHLKETLELVISQKEMAERSFEEKFAHFKEKNRILEEKKDTVTKLESLSSKLGTEITVVEAVTAQLSHQCNEYDYSSKETVSRMTKMNKHLDKRITRAISLYESRGNRIDNQRLLKTQVSELRGLLDDFAILFNNHFNSMQLNAHNSLIDVKEVQHNIREKAERTLLLFEGFQNRMNTTCRGLRRENEDFLADLYCDISEIKRLVKAIDFTPIDVPDIPLTDSINVKFVEPPNLCQLEEVFEIVDQIRSSRSRQKQHEEDFCRDFSEYRNNIKKLTNKLISFNTVLYDLPDLNESAKKVLSCCESVTCDVGSFPEIEFLQLDLSNSYDVLFDRMNEFIEGSYVVISKVGESVEDLQLEFPKDLEVLLEGIINEMSGVLSHIGSITPYTFMQDFSSQIYEIINSIKLTISEFQ